MLTFLRVLEEQDNLCKRSDTGWKPEALNECRNVVQQVYSSTGQSIVDKLKSNYCMYASPVRGEVRQACLSI